MREGYEVYKMYLEDYTEEISKGEAIILEVRDLGEFMRKVVKAKVSKDPSELPDGEKLWIRDLNDEIISESWAIKILEELPDDAFNPKRRPTQKGFR
jgi:hypothetical protein